MKKKLIPILMVIMLTSVTLLSGCTTPGKDFDTIKIVTSIQRNGGDFSLTPTGANGYEMHTCIGRLSVEALGFDLDQQSIKAQYQEAYDAQKAQEDAIYGGGTLGKIKAWWYRIVDTDNDYYKTNTISDLGLADGIFTKATSQLQVIENMNADGIWTGLQDLEIDTSGLETVPNFGLGIYTATIPFGDKEYEPGYIVATDPLDITSTGITITPNNGRSTGFVIDTGSDYRVVILTNEPAFAKDPIEISIALDLIKPDLQTGAKATYTSASNFLGIYQTNMEEDLWNVCGNLETSLASASNGIIEKAVNAATGNSLILKTLGGLNGLTLNTVDVSPAMEKEIEVALQGIQTRGKDVYPNTWSTIHKIWDDVDTIKIFTSFFDIFGTSYSLNTKDNKLSENDIDVLSKIYSKDYTQLHINGHVVGDGWWILKFGNPYYSQWDSLVNVMTKDETAYRDKHDLDWFIDTWTAHGVHFDGPVAHIQLIDDSMLGVFDHASMSYFKEKYGIDVDEAWKAGTAELENMSNQVSQTVIQALPAWLFDNTLQTQYDDLQEEVDDLGLQLTAALSKLDDIMINIQSLIPEEPIVTIFPYVVPTPYFTKILNETGDFIQADPTTHFTAHCTVSNHSNYSIDPGYPRAIIKTQKEGTLTIPLELDSDTGTYSLYLDMIGVENLSIGETVKTYFEVRASNATLTKTDRSMMYYTRIERSWLQEAFDRLGLVIDGYQDYLDEIAAAGGWLTNDDNPFISGNQSTLDDFYCRLVVTNSEGEELFIRSPLKTFQMKQNDSQVLSWEVMTFQDEDYNVRIVLGNDTSDNLVEYTTTIKGNTKSLTERITEWNPLAKDE